MTYFEQFRPLATLDDLGILFNKIRNLRGKWRLLLPDSSGQKIPEARKIGPPSPSIQIRDRIPFKNTVDDFLILVLFPSLLPG